MTWLPDYGVGIIAFGNLTYTGWGRVATSALEVARKEGRPAAAVAEALAGAQRSARQGVAAHRGWDDRLADSIAAENLFPRSIEGSPSRGDRAPARAGRRLHAGQRLRYSRKRAPRIVDDELRTREAGGVDHAGADDAAEGAVPVSVAGAGDDGARRHVPSRDATARAGCRRRRHGYTAAATPRSSSSAGVSPWAGTRDSFLRPRASGGLCRAPDASDAPISMAGRGGGARKARSVRYIRCRTSALRGGRDQRCRRNGAGTVTVRARSGDTRTPGAPRRSSRRCRARRSAGT